MVADATKVPVADVVDVDFEPLWDYILMKPIPKSETKGGIVLPDGVKEDDMARSVVIKAGAGAYRESGAFIENPIKVGDIVYHMAKMMPFKVILNGVTYLCVSGRDVVAKTSKPAA